MSEQRSDYANTTAECIKKVSDRWGWNSYLTTPYILAQIAINLGLLADCAVEIYGAQRKHEIDKENG